MLMINHVVSGKGAVEDILRFFDAQAPNLAGVRLRAVLVRSDEGWHATHWTARAVAGQEQLERRSDEEYTDLRLVERWVEPADFGAVLRRICETGDGPEFRTAPISAEFLRTWSPSNPRRSPQVEWRIGPASSESTPTLPMMTQFGFDTPLIPNPLRSAGRWLGDSQLARGDGALQRYALVRLPETRSWFRAVRRLSHTEVEIDVARATSFDVPVRLRMAVRTGEREYSAFADVPEGPHVAPIPGDAREISMCLLAADGTLLDLHDEDRHSLRGTGRLIDATRSSKSDIDGLRELIAQGEGEQVEFKEAVRLRTGDEKFKELVETVCAMANRTGGRVLIGIGNHGETAGIGLALREVESEDRTSERLRSAYRIALLDRLRADLTPEPEIAGEFVPLDGKHVLVLQVQESEDKPVEIASRRTVFVRRGSTDMRPGRDQILGLLQEPESDQPDAFV